MTARAARPPASLWPAGDPAYRERWLTVEGDEIRVLERGDAASPPAVLVPGWASSAYVLHATADAVAASGHRVVLVEPRGLGASSKPVRPEAYTPSALVRHLLAILDALAIRRGALVGLSMGGGLVLRAALEAPERTTRLVLLDPAGIGRIPLAALARIPGAPLVARLVQRLPASAHRLIARIALHGVYGDADRITPRDLDEFEVLTGTRDYFAAQIAMLRGYDWRPLGAAALRELRAPALLVRGSRDRLVRVRDLEALRASLPPTIRLRVVAGAGHAPGLECPELVAREITEFLRGADDPPPG